MHMTHTDRDIGFDITKSFFFIIQKNIDEIKMELTEKMTQTQI